MRSLTVSILAAVLMSPSTWASSPAAQNGVVITTNPDFVEGCEYAGEVRAGSSWGGLTMKKVAEKKTYKKLTKRAAEAGMDVVLVHFSKVGFGGSCVSDTDCLGYVPQRGNTCIFSTCTTMSGYLGDCDDFFDCINMLDCHDGVCS